MRPLILVVEYLYDDFADACRQVLDMTFEPPDKMCEMSLPYPRGHRTPTTSVYNLTRRAASIAKLNRTAGQYSASV
jgi:hypothetical protein